jgi:hypothetical protein
VLERFLCLAERVRACACVVPGGVPVRFGDEALGQQDGLAGLACCYLSDPGQVYRLIGACDVDSLLTHGREDLRAEPVIAGDTREGQCLDQVALRKAVLLGVVGHPGKLG